MIEIDRPDVFGDLRGQCGLADLARPDQPYGSLAGQPCANFRKRPSLDHRCTAAGSEAVHACSQGRTGPGLGGPAG